MREIIAVSPSEKKARERVARVLDRYLWRIGDQTWRGKATNACLDRLARELRHKATRNTAVTIYEVRSAAASRIPIIRIGARHAFSPEGYAPVSSSPAAFEHAKAARTNRPHAAAVLEIAALFHDLGKATCLFQAKLRRSIASKKASGAKEGDAVRHELFSAYVWDHLFGDVDDDAIVSALHNLSPEQIDTACEAVIEPLSRLYATASHAGSMNLAFSQAPGSIRFAVGMLILTHHKLPDADSKQTNLLSSVHVRPHLPMEPSKDLSIAPGPRFWHEVWWKSALDSAASCLRPGTAMAGADIALRASLMLADHFGSHASVARNEVGQEEHLANTKKLFPSGVRVPADSLVLHTKRVARWTRFAYASLHTLRERYPALSEDSVPRLIAYPLPSDNPRFAWQHAAADAARTLVAEQEGGFFAAIIAGTGTGKTRGAPTILASAAFHVAVPHRRYMRMNLCLGLRILATQSAQEYVDDLGFSHADVAVLVGETPLSFDDNLVEENDEGGSQEPDVLPDWLRVEHPSAHVPTEGSPEEALWLQRLSVDTDQSLPAFVSRYVEMGGASSAKGKRMLSAPILVATIDHLMGVAAPTNSRYLLQSVRMMTSDLILDEIDQYDAEDLAAVLRLVYQTAVSGRRVVIMSATLTPDIAKSFHQAYEAGWKAHAEACGVSSHVHVLVSGDTVDSVSTNALGETLDVLVARTTDAIVRNINRTVPLRLGYILPEVEGWQSIVEQIDKSCSELHDANASDIDGFRVSMGMVRLTRISHTAALATQLPSGCVRGHYRVLVCLHSQMPRIHRAFIEHQIKRALTRKGDEPNLGLRRLCIEQDLFMRASQEGVKDIEVVVVTTPVIETGNDIDLDWAILDPISTRSVIQSAGRVRRHRAPAGSVPNIHILAQSLVAADSGSLSKPGVETSLPGETFVPTPCLDMFPGRSFLALKGDADFTHINAASVLSPVANFPLLRVETDLRLSMLSPRSVDPVGLFLHDSRVRWNKAMVSARKFRRSNEREALYVAQGNTPAEMVWFVDLDPGKRESVLRDLGTSLECVSHDGVHKLFTDIDASSWRALEASMLRKQMDTEVLSAVFCASVPMYDADVMPKVTYSAFTGFTRGSAEHLFSAFGKIKH